MKTMSISQNATVQKVTDFMDRVPGLVSLVSFAVTLVIVAGFIG
jgi:hypothetical protein